VIKKGFVQLWTLMGGAAVEPGETLPEPGANALLVSGCLALFLLARTRRAQR
jgi:hypothetical protein